MRELSGEPLLRDHITLWVHASTWQCPFCSPGGDGVYTTVSWIGKGDGPDGRCSACGVKLRLARMGEHVPSVEEQLGGR